MKKSLFFGLSALLAAGFTACKDDTFNHSQPLEADQTYYVSFMISDATNLGSRAGEGDDGREYPNFDEGSDEEGSYKENYVSSVYLFFYDINQNRVGNSVLINHLPNLDLINVSDPSGSIHSAYAGVTEVNLSKGEELPAYVVAIINPVSEEWNQTGFQNQLATIPMLKNATIKEVYGTNGFGMSNAVYYDTYHEPTDITGSKNDKTLPSVYTKISENGLYATQAAAEAAIKGENANYSFELYVERYAAKVKFDINTSLAEASTNNKVKATLVGEIDDFGNESGNEEVALVFDADYWWVNAQEESTYIVKSFRKEGTLGEDQDDRTFGDLFEAIGMNAKHRNWVWNSQSNHRSYWAQSPAYYGQKFPRVSDDIMDKEEDGEYSIVGGIKKHTPQYYSLKYFSYNEIADKAKTDKSYLIKNNGGLGYQYIRENTMSASALDPKQHMDEDKYNYKAVIPSIVVTGKYSVTGYSGNIEDYMPSNTFYIQGSSTSNNYKLYNKDNIEKALRLRTLGVLSSKADGSEVISAQQFNAYFEIEHPSEATRSISDEASPAISAVDVDRELIIDARYVTMQTKNVDSATGIYFNNGEKWVEYDPNDKNMVKLVNRQLIATLGLIRKYDSGLAYFYIPIKHSRFNIKQSDSFNMGEDGLIEPTAKEYNWSQVRLGDFGIVRNHIYDIVATAITGLGTGIINPDTPIVPPVDEEEYFTATKINILNWAVVPQQKVVLE